MIEIMIEIKTFKRGRTFIRLAEVGIDAFVVERWHGGRLIEGLEFKRMKDAERAYNVLIRRW